MFFSFQLQHVGSSSLTRDEAQALCIRSMEFFPLDHQGSPQGLFCSFGWVAVLSCVRLAATL